MQPMLATPADGALPRGAAWAYEVKWDGVRALSSTRVAADGAAVWRLLSRSGRDVTVSYPELAGLAHVQDGVLDGEIVLMQAGRPSFEALATRMHVRDPAQAVHLARLQPVTFLVFDVLALDGVDLVSRPYDERREVLARLDLPEHVQLSPVYDDGEALWQVTREHGLEGVVAKRRDARYRPGVRSPDWVKRAHRRSRSALVCGWRPESTGTGRLGALLLGAPDGDGALRYLGRAGSGVSGQLAADLAVRLDPLALPAPPFDEPVPAIDARGTHWVRPALVVDVVYLGRTEAGRLRQPAVRGLRDDALADPWDVA